MNFFQFCIAQRTGHFFKNEFLKDPSITQYIIGFSCNYFSLIKFFLSMSVKVVQCSHDGRDLADEWTGVSVDGKF